MIANTEGGVSSRAADPRIHRLSSRWNPSPTGELEAALERTRGWLVSRQHADGHWVGELEGDTILESEYILLLAFLGREADPICTKCARYILDHQLPDGGWSIYPGGPAEISASVKAYFALKLVGYSPDDPALVRARQAILEAGGAHACNSFTRFYLALLGQIGYDECPSVPPELVLIPSRLNFSLERDVGLDPDDRGAAVDHVALQAGASDRARSGASASCSWHRDLLEPGTGMASSPGRASSSAWTGSSSGATAGCRRPGGSAGSRRPTAGCSSTSRTPTAWARSSPR